jgi:hypothetical protein
MEMRTMMKMSSVSGSLSVTKRGQVQWYIGGAYKTGMPRKKAIQGDLNQSL